MDLGLRSNKGQLSERLGNLQKAGTHAEHIKGAQSLLDFVDRNRPSLAQKAHETGKLSRLFEKYEKKIRMQHNDPDKELSSSEIAKDFFLASTLDNTKASEVKVIELRYLTKLRNPPLNPRQFLGSRPLSNSAYKNYLHWSRKSIMLEQKMRSYYDVANPKIVQDHVLLMSCLENGTFLPVVDTFWSIDVDSIGDEIIDRPIHRLQSADHFDWKRNNIIKTAHHPSEIDSLALSSVNDFLTYQKLARASFLGLPPMAKPSVKKGKTFITDKENHAINHTDDDKHEGDCKVEAILIAETNDGCQHVRPLCTTSDVALALYELADPEIFDRGFLQLPHTLNMHYDRWVEGYYRYMYRAKEESYLEYVEPNVPSDHADISNFLFPAALCEYKDVRATRISTHAMPESIQDFCDAVVAAFYHAYQSVGQVVLSMDFDFEAIVVGCPPFPKDLPRAPHRVRLRSGWEFQYRAACFRNIKSQVSFSSQRRNAVTGLDGMKKSFLKQFHSFFVEALQKLESHEHAFVDNGEDRNLPKLMGYQAARKIFLSIQEENESDSSDGVVPEPQDTATNDDTAVHVSMEEMAATLTEDLSRTTDEQEKKERFSVQLLKKYHRNKIREERRESHVKLGGKAKEERRISLALLGERQCVKPTSLNDSDDSDDSFSSASSSTPSHVSKNDQRRSSFRTGGKAVLFLGHNKSIKHRKPAKLTEEDEKDSEDEELKQQFFKEKKDKQAETLSNWAVQEKLAQILSPAIKLDSTGKFFHDLLHHDSFASMDMNHHIRAMLAETFPTKSKKRSKIDKLSVPDWTSPFDAAVTADALSFLNLSNLVDYTKEVKLAEDMEKSVAEFCRNTDILELLSNDEITKRLKDKLWEIKSTHETATIDVVDDVEEKRLLAILDAVRAAEEKRKFEMDKPSPSKRKGKLKGIKEKFKPVSPPKVPKVDNTNPDEIEKTLQSILQLLNPDLATKLRKGLNNYLTRLRQNKTKKFIMRRRRQESLTEQQVNDLSRYYYSLPMDSDSSASSDDEKKNSKRQDSVKKNSEDPHALDNFNLSELIGDLANEDHLQSLIQSRAAEANIEKALQQKQEHSVLGVIPRSASRPFSPPPRVKTPSTAHSTAPSSADPTSIRLSVRTATPKSADSARARASMKSNQRLSTRVAVPSVLINAGDVIAVDESQRRKEAMSSFYYNLFHPSSNKIASEPALDSNPKETPHTASTVISTIDSTRVPTRDGQDEERNGSAPAIEQNLALSSPALIPKRNSLWGPVVVPCGDANSSATTAGDDIIAKVLREMKWEEELRQRRQALIIQQQTIQSLSETTHSPQNQEKQEHANKLRQVAENYRNKKENLNLSIDDEMSDGEQEDNLQDHKAEYPAEDTFPGDILPVSKSSFAMNMPIEMQFSPSSTNGQMSPSVGNRTRLPSILFLKDMKDEPIARLQFIGSSPFIAQTPTSPNSEDGLSGNNSPFSNSCPHSSQHLKRILPPQVSISSVSRANDVPNVPAVAASSTIIESYIESLSRPSSTTNERKPRPNSPRPRNRSKTRISSSSEPVVDETPQNATTLESPTVPLSSAFPDDSVISTMVEKVANFFKHNTPVTVDISQSILVDPIVEEAALKEEDLFIDDTIDTDKLTQDSATIDKESILFSKQTSSESINSKNLFDSKTKESIQMTNLLISSNSGITNNLHSTESGKDLVDFTEIAYNDLQEEVFFDNTLIPLIYLPSSDSIRHDPLAPSVLNQQYQTIATTVSRAVTAMQQENQESFVQVPIRPETSAATFVDGRVYPKTRFGRKISESNDSEKHTALKPRIPSCPRPSSAGFTSRKPTTSTSDLKELHHHTNQLAVAFGFATDEKKQKKERQHAVAIPDSRNDFHPKIGLLGQSIQPPGVSDKLPPSAVSSMPTCLNPEWYSTSAQLETTQIKASLASNPSMTPHHPRDQLPTHISVSSTAPVVYHIPIPQPARLPITVLPEPNIPSLSPPVVHMPQELSMSPDVTRVGLNINILSPFATTSTRLSPSLPNNSNNQVKKKVRIMEDIKSTNGLSSNLSNGKESQPLDIVTEECRYDLPFKIEVVRGLKTGDHIQTMSCESSSLDKTNISSIVMLSPTGGTHVRTFSFDDTFIEEEAPVFGTEKAHRSETMEALPITSLQLEEQSHSIVSDIATKLLHAPETTPHLLPEVANDSVSYSSLLLKGESSSFTDHSKLIEKNSISSILLGKGGSENAEYIPEFFVLPDLSLLGGDTAITAAPDEASVNDAIANDQHHQTLWQKEFDSMEYSCSVASVPPVSTAAPPKSSFLSPNSTSKTTKQQYLDTQENEALVVDKLSNDKYDDASVIPAGILLHALSISSLYEGKEVVSAALSLENMPVVEGSLEDTSLTPLLASGSMSPSHTIAGIRGLNSSLASLSVASNSYVLPDAGQLDRLIESIPNGKILKKRNDPLKTFHLKDKNKNTSLLSEGRMLPNKIVHHTPTVEPLLSPEDSNISTAAAVSIPTERSHRVPPPSLPLKRPTTTFANLVSSSSASQHPRKQQGQKQQHQDAPSSSINCHNSTINNPALMVVNQGNTSFAPANNQFDALTSFLSQQQQPRREHTDKR